MTRDVESGESSGTRVRVGIVVFPGTNCEFDVAEAIRAAYGEPVFCWHADAALGEVDAVVVPGGFAHGDYLRPGALARFSPIMGAIATFARDGGPVVGICNGFQVLTEAGLLPGALIKNAGLRFRCEMAEVVVESTRSPLTRGLTIGTVLRVPINHFEGNYLIDDAGLESLRANDQVVFRYANNPNGSRDSIAGISSNGGNVVGLMPHPERALSELVGSSDGLALWRNLVAGCRRQATV